METALATVNPAEVEISKLSGFTDRVNEAVRSSRAANTVRGYKRDWADFQTWSAATGVTSLPASAPAVASYLTDISAEHVRNGKSRRALKAGSIQRRVSSIASAHTSAGFDSPCAHPMVKLTLAGIRRTIGTRTEGKAPILTNDLAVMVSKLPKGLKGTRDRAILLFGFAGAFRRSELVGLNLEDVEFTSDGARVTIRRSKTDQEGSGQMIGIARGSALCPVRALEGWIAGSGIQSGPIFRSVRRYGQLEPTRLTAEAVADVVQRFARAAGLDPARYAGHSLRAGLVTQAAINEVPESRIMAQTRHKTPAMVQRYIRDANVFRGNVSARVGL